MFRPTINSLLGIAALFSIAAVLACSSSKGGQADGGNLPDGGVSETVGPEGGTVQTPDGTMIIIPAGALDNMTTITIYPTSDSVGDLPKVGNVYTFLPEGLVFNIPTEVTIPFAIGTTGDLVVYWSIAGNKQVFDQLAGTVSGNTISASVTHFSNGFAGRPTTQDGGSDGGSEDASTDAGVEDAGQSDSGTDAGVEDAGQSDSGTDAGIEDAGQTDSGTDAGVEDAGQADSGADSGVQDAGMTDAGADAGPVPVPPLSGCKYSDTNTFVFNHNVTVALVLTCTSGTPVFFTGAIGLTEDTGLVFHSSNGAIDGTASMVHAQKVYPVTVCNSDSSSCQIINLTITVQEVTASDVTNLTATPDYEKVSLTWTNGSTNFDYAKVVRNDSYYPTNVNDGIVVAGCGQVTDENCDDTGSLVNGTTYFYKVFGYYNSVPSKGIPVKAAPAWESEFVETPKFFANGTSRALALKSDGTPCIAYGGYNLYVACQGIPIIPVDDTPGVGEYASIAIDQNDNDRIHVSYFNRPGNNLKYARQNDASGFDIYTVDTEEEVGTGGSIAVDQDGSVHISYFNNYYTDVPIRDRKIKYAFRDHSTGAWSITDNIDPGLYFIHGFSTSIAVDALYNVHVSYLYQFDVLGKLVIKYAFFDDDWQTGYIWGGGTDPTARLYTASLAVDAANAPHVAFYIVTGSPLYIANTYHAKYESAYWYPMPISAARSDPVDPNQFSSIAIGTDDSIHITYDAYAYDDDTGDYFWEQQHITSTDGGVWSTPYVVDKDTTGSDYRFSHSSIAVKKDTPTDNVYISYYDELNAVLKGAIFNGTSWSAPIPIDNETVVGWYTSLVALADDDVHLAYYDLTNRAVKYAHFNGTAWQISIVDDVNVGLYPAVSFVPLNGSGVSMAVSPEGNNINISYYDANAKDLRYAKSSNGVDWVKEPVDSSGNVGQFNSIDRSADGTIHISYLNNNNSTAQLKYAYNNNDGSGWHNSTVPFAGKITYGYFTSLKAEGGNIHVSYFSKCDDTLAYSKYSSATWSSKNLDAAGSEYGYGTSLVVDKDQNVHIAHTNSEGNKLLYSYDEGSSSIVDSGVGVGIPSITADDTNVYIAYNNSGNLKLARKTLSGGSWQKTVVEGGSAASYISISVSGNTVYISYYDGFNKTVKVAKHTFQ